MSSLKCEEGSVKCEESLRLPLHCTGVAQVILDNNTATASHKARTHGLGWRTAHASSIDEKGLIYISLRQVPPRLVRVLLVAVYVQVSDLYDGCILRMMPQIRRR